MPKNVKYIPEGSHTLTPYLTIQGAAKAIEFYKKTFGAKEETRMDGPDGKVMHAELRIGDSNIMISDELPGANCKSPSTLRGTTVGLYLYVQDVDEVFGRALTAGAKVRQPLENKFWGDRHGELEDPFGHRWSLATHKEDLTPQQIQQRAREMFAQPAKA
ncbi:MAG: VOC family protein [Elusimicrobia bacterium]|nr:VOC family protein [Elusimicrobiota bacterium]